MDKSLFGGPSPFPSPPKGERGGEGDKSAAWRCDLCGSAAGEPIAPWIVRCDGCSLVATHPQPDGAALARRYGSGYYAGWNCGGGRGRLWRDRLRIVQKFLSSGSILDVGCGSGEFLAMARGAGFQVAGTEFSEAARASIREFPVYPSPRETPGTWDAVTLWHVLEHGRSPRRMLSSVREKLRPDGFLFIAVPNVESAWFDSIYRCFKWKSPELYTPEAKEPHLFHFSSRTLRRYLESGGFKPTWEALDVPDADWRKRLVDLPARLWYRLSGVNRAMTLLLVSRRA